MMREPKYHIGQCFKTTTGNYYFRIIGLNRFHPWQPIAANYSYEIEMVYASDKGGAVQYQLNPREKADVLESLDMYQIPATEYYRVRSLIVELIQAKGNPVDGYARMDISLPENDEPEVLGAAVQQPNGEVHFYEKDGDDLKRVE